MFSFCRHRDLKIIVLSKTDFLKEQNYNRKYLFCFRLSLPSSCDLKFSELSWAEELSIAQVFSDKIQLSSHQRSFERAQLSLLSLAT